MNKGMVLSLCGSLSEWNKNKIRDKSGENKTIWEARGRGVRPLGPDQYSES